MILPFILLRVRQKFRACKSWKNAESCRPALFTIPHVPAYNILQTSLRADATGFAPVRHKNRRLRAALPTSFCPIDAVFFLHSPLVVHGENFTRVNFSTASREGGNWNALFYSAVNFISRAQTSRDIKYSANIIARAGNIDCDTRMRKS